ncbi:MULTISPECIES: co-chaperone YbbN [unclassified Thioalkalivibrio]|uniref:thioredoxin family protein n=1 Tax=unclassified Thioalkalivibrio TaxID=2621013 RepID=UPI00035F5E25|nr:MULTISPECIES: thioredoxin family protein [unclassified Thioalkalivibrio]
MPQPSRVDESPASGGLPALDAGGFHHRLQEVDGAAVVMFTRPGCSACHAMGDALRRWRAEGDAPELFRVDAEIDTALVREFEVFHLPALFVFLDGEYHGPLQAPPRVPLLRAALEERLRQPPEEAP